MFRSLPGSRVARVDLARSSAVLRPLFVLAILLASCNQNGNVDSEGGQHMSIVATPTTQTVTQGGQGAAHVAVTRPAAAPGSVALSFNGPAGQLLAADTLPPGTSSTDVALDIPLTFPTGNNTVTVTASATGASNGTQTIVLNVGPVAGTPVSVKLCPTFTLLWAASISEGMSWVQRQVINNGFSLAMGSPRGMLAFTKLDASGDITTHLIADTPANLAQMYTGNCAADSSKVSVSGVLLGVVAPDHVYVSADFGTVDLAAPATIGATVPFSLPKVRAGIVDFFASSRGSVNGAPITGLFIPNIAIPASGNVTVDLNASNRFTFASGGLAVGNLLSRSIVVASYIYTPNGTRGKIAESAPSISPTNPIYGLPPTLLPSNAIHEFSATATGSADTRKITIYSHLLPSGLTGNLPPLITFNPSCLSTAGSPVRLGFTGTTPAGLDQAWNLKLAQGTTGNMRKVEMNFGSAYTIAAQIYNFITPDWSTINYKSAWAPQPNVPISAMNTVKGSNLIGGATSWNPVDGKTVYESMYSGTVQCQ